MNIEKAKKAAELVQNIDNAEKQVLLVCIVAKVFVKILD